MNPLAAAPLHDVQALEDHRELAIDEVGIEDLRYPVAITDRSGVPQATVAMIAMDVDLASDAKGTHMSRFVEVLVAGSEHISVTSLGRIAVGLHERLGGSRARIALRFPYFRERAAPVSGLSALAEFEAGLVAEFSEGRLALGVSVRVPVTSLCPCSKEISDYGAHNQRGYVDLDVDCSPERPVWLDDLIDVGEGCGSAPIYTLLKRVDERHVTMQAYDNPAFVEDIARDAALALRDDQRVHSFEVCVSNQESIHNHSAVARIRQGRMP